MLELIFQDFIEWIYSLALDCWNWISSSLLDIMSLDLAYIKSHVPIICPTQSWRKETGQHLKKEAGPEEESGKKQKTVTVSTTAPECGMFYKEEHKRSFAYETHSGWGKLLNGEIGDGA